MDIYTVLALLLVVFACSTLLGFWAGVARSREDRLNSQARAWDKGRREGLYDFRATNRVRFDDRPNPYRTELERRNAR